MKRITFNLNTFITDLHNCYAHETYDLIDDVVQKYKDFLRHASEGIQVDSKAYLMGHWLVKDDEVIKSYITACHKNRGV